MTNSVVPEQLFGFVPYIVAARKTVEHKSVLALKLSFGLQSTELCTKTA
jgi:hypothetical protein